MLSVRLSNEIEDRLNILASKTKRTKSHYVEEALQGFLDDKEDYLLALSRLEESGANITLAKVKDELGLNNDQ